MKFEFVRPEDAKGAILGHDMSVGDLFCKEGTLIDSTVIAGLVARGITEVCAVRLEQGEVSEDSAVEQMVDALNLSSLATSVPRSGRVNIFAVKDGVALIDQNLVHALNAVDPGLSITTVPQLGIVRHGHRVASVKVIPFGVHPRRISAWVDTARSAPHPVIAIAAKVLHLALIVTSEVNSQEEISRNLIAQLQACLQSMGGALIEIGQCQHTVSALQEKLSLAQADDSIDAVIVAGAQPTLDENDIVGRAIAACGGHVTFLGLPVDPGNQTMCAMIGTKAVVVVSVVNAVLPTPSLKMILARIGAELPLSHASLVGLAVGGLS